MKTKILVLFLADFQHSFIKTRYLAGRFINADSKIRIGCSKLLNELCGFRFLTAGKHLLGRQSLELIQQVAFRLAPLFVRFIHRFRSAHILRQTV